MNPLDSIKNTMAFSSKDWSLCSDDAWIYGIVLGWDDALDFICETYQWNTETKARLVHLHDIWNQIYEKHQ